MPPRPKPKPRRSHHALVAWAVVYLRRIAGTPYAEYHNNRDDARDSARLLSLSGIERVAVRRLPFTVPADALKPPRRRRDDRPGFVGRVGKP